MESNEVQVALWQEIGREATRRQGRNPVVDGQDLTQRVWLKFLSRYSSEDEIPTDARERAAIISQAILNETRSAHRTKQREMARLNEQGERARVKLRTRLRIDEVPEIVSLPTLCALLDRIEKEHPALALHLEGVPTIEIARRLGRSERTIQRRLLRAKTDLTAEILDQHPPKKITKKEKAA